MAYVFALLYLVCVYIRPAEIIPGWEDAPIVAILAAVATVAVSGSLVLRPRRFWNLPQDWFVLGFLLAIVVSNAAWGWLAGAVDALLTIAPAIFCYFLLRSAVESARQLRWVGYTLVALTLVHAANGIVQFHTGIGFGGIAPIEAHSFSIDDQVPEEIQRIRGMGIFNDPNDLALTLVIAVPFLAGPLSRRATATHLRALSLLLLVPLVVAVYYTNSRGGMLGLGAALLPYLSARAARSAAPVLLVAGLAVLVVVGPSRMAVLDAAEPSAQGRVQSWSEGLQMFKSRPIFGVGFGRYTDFNALVAHNAFVHTLGELGLFGSFFFVGMAYWFFHNARHHSAIADMAWGSDLWQSGIAFAICAMFLSRQYNVLVFIWLAMSGCYADVTNSSAAVTSPRMVVHLMRIAAITAGGVFGTYTVVRLFASWSA